jgi:hypothetical protein
MTLTPFDIPAPNADDPSPRSVVPMFPHRMAQATRDDAALQAIRDRLNSKPRLVEIKPTWRDDLAELVGEIRAAPLSHAVVAVAGFMVGTFGILALAELAVRL